MEFDRREDIIAITPMWEGERYPNGRPKVSDKLLDALYDMTLEEVWKAIFLLGYESQFIKMDSLHPEFNSDGTVNRKLIGRAVTAAYVPIRPDYDLATRKIAEKKGYKGMLPNQWIIDNLVDRDVIVIDLFDKIFQGTFIGGNLATAIKTKTNTGGAVIWGAIRDLEQVYSIPDIQVYYRGVDPTGLRKISMLSYNMPVVLGSDRYAAVCLPGDVVYGCSGGVLFIPPHLLEEVIKTGRKSKVKDICGFKLLSENKFTAAEIDRLVWTKKMLDLLVDFIKNDPQGKEFQDLDWSEEYELAKQGEAYGQSAL
ncbi:MAG: RraA family protein [Spirochaetales bacterium]|jgi:regulator of RNase E activity RraA|nr:RraA family protein [Spirochaetota bacterium]NLL25365.1 RraA family protein [Spirochaetales bacterium]